MKQRWALDEEGVRQTTGYDAIFSSQVDLQKALTTAAGYIELVVVFGPQGVKELDLIKPIGVSLRLFVENRSGQDLQGRCHAVDTRDLN
jgi:hypothetical protein